MHINIIKHFVRNRKTFTEMKLTRKRLASPFSNVLTMPQQQNTSKYISLQSKTFKHHAT